jgi:hypothetical protein
MLNPKELCSIRRAGKGVVFYVPARLTDTEIWSILKIANDAYQLGRMT